MQEALAAARHYDRPTIWLHWTIAVLVPLQWGLMVLAGMFLVYVRGDSIFGLFTVPALDPGNKALRHDIAEVHETIAALLLIVAGLHALAALVHHYVLRDGVLRRMWPRAI
jgi:cytochrome b561